MNEPGYFPRGKEWFPIAGTCRYADRVCGEEDQTGIFRPWRKDLTGLILGLKAAAIICAIVLPPLYMIGEFVNGSN